MKVVILAGGYGTRISEESDHKPKPMIEIGGKPILWHIMKSYSYYGFNEFIICCGYKSHVIKSYFYNYLHNTTDFTIDFTSNQLFYHNTTSENWKITLLDTGLNTMTASRLLRAKPHLQDKSFMLTYGDGLSDVNLPLLISSHTSHNSIMTLTAVRIPGRFGAIDIGPDRLVQSFKEKPRGDLGWINGGFFVCEPEIFKYIENENDVILEQGPMAKLVKEGRLSAFKHDGFWMPMDTMKDKNELERLWSEGAPWKKWK